MKARILALTVLLCACAAIQAAGEATIRPGDGDAGQFVDDSEQMKFEEPRLEEDWKKWPAKVRQECIKYFNGETVVKLKDGHHQSLLWHTILGMPSPFCPNYYRITLKDQRDDKYKVEFWHGFRQFERQGESREWISLAIEDEHAKPLTELPPEVLDATKKLGADVVWNDSAKIEKEGDDQRVFKFKGKLNGKTVKVEIYENGKIKKADKLLQTQSQDASPNKD